MYYKIIEMVLIIIVIIGIIIYTYYVRNSKRKYIKMVKKNRYMAHALGGIDGENYTNSKEALESNYNKGIRLFEVDINLTADGKIVCVHGWKKSDYEKKIGIKYNSENSIMTYEKFKNVKIKDKYTTMGFDDLVSYMKKYKDIYVMLDIGSKTYEETKKIYSEILNVTQNKNILDRLITGRTHCGYD